MDRSAFLAVFRAHHTLPNAVVFSSPGPMVEKESPSIWDAMTDAELRRLFDGFLYCIFCKPVNVDKRRHGEKDHDNQK